MTLILRLWYLLLGWGSVGVIYSVTERLQGAGYVMSPGWIDRMIPFSSEAIWPYLSFFVLIPFAYLLSPVSRLKWLATSMLMTALGAGMIYLLWPTTLAYPLDQGSGVSSKILAVLMQVDSPQNCLPSLHVALTVLAVWALSDDKRPWRSAGFVAWGMVIAFSILQLRRHLFIDLISGALLALVVGAIGQKINGIRK